MKKYLLTLIALYAGFFSLAYLHLSLGTYFTDQYASSDYIFSYGFVVFLLGCVFAMSWGNVASFEDLQRRISTKQNFGIWLGSMLMLTAVLLMITASFF